MKKKIIVLVASLFLIATGVSASSLNGEYNGNPIVKIKSNGNVVDPGEVPAMIYDGKTLVPISSLRNLGATVTWDANTYSVDVTLPQPSTTVSDLRNLVQKKNASMANMYKLTEDLSERLAEYSDFLSFYFNVHNSNGDSTYVDKTIVERLPQLQEHYNFIVNRFNSIKGSLNGFDMTDINNIINNNYNAIEYYKTATLDVIKWNTYKITGDLYNNQLSFNNYQKNSHSGFTISNQAITDSSKGYDTYILKVIGD